MDSKIEIYIRLPLNQMSILDILVAFRDSAHKAGRDYAEILTKVKELVAMDRKAMYDELEKFCTFFIL